MGDSESNLKIMHVNIVNAKLKVNFNNSRTTYSAIVNKQIYLPPNTHPIKTKLSVNQRV